MPTNSPPSPSQRAQSPSIAASTADPRHAPERRAVFHGIGRRTARSTRQTTAARTLSFSSTLAASSAIDTSEPVAINVTSRLPPVQQRRSAERDRLVSSATSRTSEAPSRTAQHRRIRICPQRAIPRLRGLDRVARAEYQQIRLSPSAMQMLDRLMRRTVFASPIESCVITWMTRIPSTRPSRIAGRLYNRQAEKRAAIRDEARHAIDAVHRSAMACSRTP